jgi:DNA-binding transcriptional ArsR family regulator
VDVLHCPVRRSILLNLATAGKANVKALTARTSIAHNTLSQHLAHLRTAGLVFSQCRGKEIWCETAEDRVRFEGSRMDDSPSPSPHGGAGWR